MAAHLICIYRGLALSRHSVKLSIQNQAACNTPETVFLGVSFPYTVMPPVFNLKSMIKYQLYVQYNRVEKEHKRSMDLACNELLAAEIPTSA